MPSISLLFQNKVGISSHCLILIADASSYYVQVYYTKKFLHKCLHEEKVWTEFGAEFSRVIISGEDAGPQWDR